MALLSAFAAALAPQLRLTEDGNLELVQESLTVTAQATELDQYRHVSEEVRGGTLGPLRCTA